MKILITGTAGMIGEKLVSELEKHREVRIFQGDIRDAEIASRMLEGVDEVFHCAGLISFRKKDERLLYDVNVTGTGNLLSASLRAGIRRFVYVSSVSALYARTNYGKSKSQAEESCSEFSRKGLDVVIARPAVVYGGRDFSGNSVLPFRQVAQSRICFAPPGGKSYVHIDDLIDGLVLSLGHGSNNSAYNFSSGYYTYEEVYRTISKFLNPTLNIVNLSPGLRSLVILLAKFSSYEHEAIDILFEEQRADNTSARDLGWTPCRSIEPAVREMCRFYLENSLL